MTVHEEAEEVTGLSRASSSSTRRTSEFLIDAQTDKFWFLEEDERVIQAAGRPVTAPPATTAAR
jgi:hypothetical protein